MCTVKYTFIKYPLTWNPDFAYLQMLAIICRNLIFILSDSNYRMIEVMALPNGDWDPALSNLLSSLEESRRELPTSEEEFGFLSSLLQSKELHALVKVYCIACFLIAQLQQASFYIFLFLGSQYYS